MPRIDQVEIDEISDAFSEAWEEFFGQPMFYVPFDESSTVKHPVYGESKGKKKYKEDEKVSFNGTFREVPIEEKGEIAGNREQNYSEITLIMKELRDKGVLEVDLRAVIDIPDRDGVTHRYNIIAKDKSVQLSDNFVFSRLRVMRDL